MATTLPVSGTVAQVKSGYESVSPVTNFATVKLTADECVLSNRLSPLDQEERLTYRSRPIDRVETSLTIRNPAPIRSGVQYNIVLEECVRTTGTNGEVLVDEPLVMMLTVRHPRSGNITESILRHAFRRLVGAVIIPAASATDTVVDLGANGHSSTRFGDLARLAEYPSRDNMNTTADT